MFRQMARDVAQDHGVLLMFLPKPIQGKRGSGMHINLSFVDAKGENALNTGPVVGPDHLKDPGRGCLAGWMRHHKGLAGLIAPTTLSHAPLQPASLSGFWCN